MDRPEHLRPNAERLIQSLFRSGRVSSVNAKDHTAKVHFEDDGDQAVSHDLEVLVTRPGDYSLPAAKSLVLCLLLPGNTGDGYVLGAHYSESDSPPTDEEGARVVAGDDTRLGSKDAEDFVSLAPATKDEIQKVLDYAKGIDAAIKAGVPVAQDGGAALQATIVIQLNLNIAPTISEPAATKVKAI